MLGSVKSLRHITCSLVFAVISCWCKPNHSHIWHGFHAGFNWSNCMHGWCTKSDNQQLSCPDLVILLYLEHNQHTASSFVQIFTRLLLSRMAATLYRTLTGQSQQSSQTNTASERPELSQVQTSQTTFGVLNHLSEQQEEILVQFKDKLQADGWWSPDSINGKATHDDGTLLYVCIVVMSNCLLRQTIPSCEEIWYQWSNWAIHRHWEMDERTASWGSLRTLWRWFLWESKVIGMLDQPEVILTDIRSILNGPVIEIEEVYPSMFMKSKGWTRKLSTNTRKNPTPTKPNYLFIRNCQHLRSFYHFLHSITIFSTLFCRYVRALKEPGQKYL